MKKLKYQAMYFTVLPKQKRKTVCSSWCYMIISTLVYFKNLNIPETGKASSTKDSYQNLQLKSFNS